MNQLFFKEWIRLISLPLSEMAAVCERYSYAPPNSFKVNILPFIWRYFCSIEKKYYLERYASFRLMEIWSSWEEKILKNMETFCTVLSYICSIISDRKMWVIPYHFLGVFFGMIETHVIFCNSKKSYIETSETTGYFMLQLIHLNWKYYFLFQDVFAFFFD